jgi:hypothetical protein
MSCFNSSETLEATVDYDYGLPIFSGSQTSSQLLSLNEGMPCTLHFLCLIVVLNVPVL